MEDPQFLNLFWELSSEKPDLIAAAIPKVIKSSQESGPEAETEFGVMTESLAYTIKRLVKGLASSRRIVKLGFCACLTALLRSIRVEASKLTLFYESFDLTLHGKQEYFIGHILLASCLIEADYELTATLIESLLGYFRSKESLREAVANVLSKVALSKSQLKKIAEVNDINFWRLKLATSKSSDSLLVQASKVKSTLLEGSYRTLPRCHSVWTMIFKAAKAEGAFKKLWSLYVEKELLSLSNQKNRGKQIGFSLSFALKAVGEGMPVEIILTTEFANAWHSNLCDKEHRHHENAVKLKRLALSKVTGTALEKIIRLAQVASVADLTSSLALEAVKTAPLEALENSLLSLKGLEDPRLSHFVVVMLDAISKREGFEKTCLIELFLKSRTDEFARRKLFTNLTQSNISVIASIFEVWDDKPADVWEKFTAEAQKVSAPLGKRKAHEATITQHQTDALWKLVLLMTLEASFESEPENLTELIETIDSLLHPKPAKRRSEDAETPLESLFSILLSMLNKQVHYRREIVKATFKEFAADAPMSLIDTLCSAVISGEGFTMEEVKEDLMGEEVDITAEEAETLLAQAVPSKAQMEELRTNFRLRACDLVEVVIKKSEDPDVLLKIYSTLFTAVQQCKQANLKARFVGLLGKLSKSKLVLKPDSLEVATELLIATVKVSGNQASTPLRPCVLSLAKAVAEVDFEAVKNAYNELLRLYIEKHTRKEIYNLLSQLLSSLPALADDALVKTLIKYSKDAKQTHSQLHAFALMKLVLAKNATTASSKHLKLALKAKTKKGAVLPPKDWVKKIIGVLLISCKKSGYKDGVLRVLNKLEKRFATVVSVQGQIVQAKKILELS